MRNTLCTPRRDTLWTGRVAFDSLRLVGERAERGHQLAPAANRDAHLLPIGIAQQLRRVQIVHLVRCQRRLQLLKARAFEQLEHLALAAAQQRRALARFGRRRQHVRHRR
eukprot:6207112-Pleurochrysis_carterae.AAC.4